MKVTFPHMGNAYIPIKCLFDELDIEVIVPPFCSKKTLEIGTKLSPDQVCLPMKINLGNYLEGLERGADTILITGSCGPCRFGYYGIVQNEILEEKGIPLEVIVLDPPQGELKPFFNRIKKVAGNRPWTLIARSLRRSIDLAKKADELERAVFFCRPREVHHGDTDRVYSHYQQDILRAKGWLEMKKVVTNYHDELRRIPLDADRNPLRIGIIGEIYTIVEPFVNLNAEQKLGNMGVHVDRSIMVSTWIFENLIYRALGQTTEKDIREAASPYLDRCIGGHAWECIGNAVRYSQKGYDGAIQILPFGCMPEIVAESILPTVSKDHNFPVMTLVVDEMTGEAGYRTRLEAFVDLLEQRRRRKMLDDKLLPGY